MTEMIEIPDPPTAAKAEQAVLGAAMLNSAVLGDCRRLVTAADFYQQRNATLFALLCDLADAGAPIDALTVIDALTRRDQLGKIGGAPYLHTLIDGVPTAANAGHYAFQVRTAARRRRVIEHGQRITQIGADATDLDDALTAIARETVALELLVDEDLDGPVTGVQTWEDFTREAADSASRWIVPGLIRRHDTIMILGASGAGKSFLSRQVAMCLAAGVHPFTLDPIAPVRTLLVDLENAPDQTAEEAGPLLTGIRQIGATEGRGLVWPYPEGLNLRTRPDAALLERVVAQTEPDVLCMGSLYNAYRRGKDDWDTAAEEVQSVLKRIRSRYGLGLWLEHHMPRKEGSGHTGTPYGGTMWERWPTHGRALRKHPDCPTGASVYLLEETFRGDRGRRDLPIALKRGGRLAWTAIWSEDDLSYDLGQLG